LTATSTNSSSTPAEGQLSAAGLGVDRQELAELFEPFVKKRFSSLDPLLWRLMARDRWRIAKRRLRRVASGADRRSPEESEAFYEDKWSRTPFDDFSPGERETRGEIYVWDGQRMLADNRGGKRLRLLFAMRVLDRLQPGSVLEVGCGSGLNTFVLAARYPRAKFCGLELAASGIDMAKDVQRLVELPLPLQSFSPRTPVDLTAHRRIEFRQGSAAELPFEANAFDLVLTSTALEQMEGIRDQALREIARVTKSHALLIEPFSDVNERGVARSYVRSQGYFRGRVAELPSYGLDPLLVYSDFPQKAKLRFLAVLAAKRAR
jgi:SAM-dependent methyltransferase